uniref:Uncharacterized protein n=1 Tax=Panagrolaimus davidi TaxID=227884 RepID=A0A914PX67_9BILA
MSYKKELQQYIKLPDSIVSDNCKEKLQLWKKSFHNSNLAILNDEDKEEKGKNWKENANFSINSTLSLHITAYENSFEPATSDSLNDESLKMDKFGSIKKQEIFDTSTFEFPRQQNFEVPNPEVCSFKASQRLFNPNEASIIVQKAGMITENWTFLWLMVFLLSTGILISITCNKNRRPPTSRRHRRPKESEGGPIISKKYDVKDGKKRGEQNGNNNEEESRNNVSYETAKE